LERFSKKGFRFTSKNQFMAKVKKDKAAQPPKPQNSERTKKEWSEGELMDAFNLTRIITYLTPEMEEWLNVSPPVLNVPEQYIFEKALLKIKKYLSGWQEEDLKMKFISPILDLGLLEDSDQVMSYFDKTISGIVENIKLTVKSDFMLAKGTLDYFRTPFFHFQEYKPYKNPSGDSMAQLLEAFLIAQVKNNNQHPLYGVEIMGGNWRFVTMIGKAYCVSEIYNSLNREQLLKIIAILRKFGTILQERLMK
jgi:hypothetical protein